MLNRGHSGRVPAGAAALCVSYTAFGQISTFPPTLQSSQATCVGSASQVTVSATGITVHYALPSNAVLALDGNRLLLSYQDAEWCGVHLTVITNWTLSASVSSIPAGSYDIYAAASPKTGDCAPTRGPELIGRVTVPACVACAGDFNHSGVVTVQDVFDFLAAYFSGSATADVNNSGSVTLQDIFDYLTAYFTPC